MVRWPGGIWQGGVLPCRERTTVQRGVLPCREWTIRCGSGPSDAGVDHPFDARVDHPFDARVDHPMSESGPSDEQEWTIRSAGVDHP